MSGNGQELTQSRRARIEAASMAWEEREQEVEALRTEHAELTVRYRGLEAEHGALRVAYERLMGEIDHYREERDRAVTRRAELEVLMETFATIVQRFQAPPSAREEADPEEDPRH